MYAVDSATTLVSSLRCSLLGCRRRLGADGVVDEDIDVYDMEKVLWAIATRTQADEDIIIFPRVVATAMDPSVRKLRVGSALGIDATKPFGQAFPEMVTVPGADKVSLEDLK